MPFWCLFQMMLAWLFWGHLTIDADGLWSIDATRLSYAYVGSCRIQTCQTWAYVNMCGQNICMHCVLALFPPKRRLKTMHGCFRCCQLLPPFKVHMFLPHSQVRYNMIYISMFLFTPLSGRTCWFYFPPQVALLMKFMP